jgi:O-antigen ligase
VSAGTSVPQLPPLRDLVPRRPVDWVIALALVSLPLAPFLNTFSPLGTALRLLLAVGVALLMVTGRISVARPLLGRGRWLIAAFAAFQIVPLLGAVGIDYGVVRAVNWTMFVPLAFVAYDRRAQRTAVAFASLAGLVLLAGVVLQALGLSGGTWPGYALSDGTPTTRYTSFLLNPNDLGLAMLSLGIVLALVTRDGERSVRVAGLGAVVACGFVVSLTFSRGALLAAAGVLVFLLLAGLGRRSLAKITAAAVVGILIIPLALPSTRESMVISLESFAGIAGGTDRSSTARADRWSRLTGGGGSRVADLPTRNGLPSWTVSSTAGAFATTEQHRDGSRSARVERKRDGGGPAPIFLRSPVAAVQPRVKYTLTGHCRPQSAPRPCRALIIFRDARGKDLRAAPGRLAISKPDRWTGFSRTDVAPAGTTQAEVRGVVLGVPEGEAHFLDSFRLVREPAGAARFSGDGGDPLGLAPVPTSAPAAENGDDRPRAATPSPAPAATSPAPVTAPGSPPTSSSSELSGRLTPAEIIFGAGYGGYAETEQLDRFELGDQKARRKAQIRATVDNGWLKLFLEEGAIGLLLFAAVCAAALWRSFSARRTAQRVLALTTGALLVALGVRALSADVLDINPWNFVLWLLVGLSFAAASREAEHDPELAPTPR